MKKKLIITIALVAVTTFTMSSYTMADSVNNTPAINSLPVTTTSTIDKDAQSKTATIPENLSLSLDDALKLIEKGNNSVVLFDREIDIYNKQYEDSLAQQQDMKQYASETMKENDAKVLKLNAPLALANLNNAKYDRDAKLKSVKIDITDQYESILAAQMNVESINEQITNLKKNIDEIKLKVNLGLAKASDIDQYNAQMASLQSSLSSQQRSIDTAMVALKQDLNINLNTKVTLTSKPLSYVKFDDTDIDGKIKKAIEKSYEIVRQKQDIENTKIEYDIYKEYSDAQENSTEISIEDKQATLDNLPITLEVQFRTAYNNLKSLEDEVEAEKLSVESCQIDLNTAQANYSIGKISNLDLLNAQLALSKEKNTLQQDINSYMKASKDFENSLD